MKRIIIAVILAVAGLTCADAQRGLAINSLFEVLRTNPQVTETFASGSQLKQYGGLIDLYHSLAVKDAPELVELITKALAKDVTKVSDRETVYRDGRLYYGLYVLESKGSSRSRCILFTNRQAGSATLIYIEGESPMVIRSLVGRK